MAELHLVGTTDDGRHLLLATTPAGAAEHRLAADQRLTEAVRAPRPAQRSSALSPREIQAELRAGASLDEVAARAGVPVSRLEPYATPVLSELARVLQDALSARMSRPQHGPSALPLALAVRAHGVDTGSDRAPRWSARRDAVAGWVVELAQADEQARVLAGWRWDRVAHSLAPLDDVAAELGHVTAGQDGVGRPASQAGIPRPPVGAAPETAPPEADRHHDLDPRPAEAPRPGRAGRQGRRPAVPTWADVLLGVSSPGPGGGQPPVEGTEAAG